MLPDCEWKNLLGKRTTVFFILSIATVVLAIATENAWDAATWMGTLELTGQAHMDV